MEAAFSDRYLVEQLLGRGDQVRVLCRGDYPFLKELDVDYLQGDVRNKDDVEKACEGVDTIYHTAAVPGIWGAWEKYHSINTQGTLNLLESAAEQGVKRFLYTSSPSVIFDNVNHLQADETLPYPDSYLCHYPHSKALAEQAVLNANGKSGMATCSIRPHLMWGPRDNHFGSPIIATRESRSVDTSRRWLQSDFCDLCGERGCRTFAGRRLFDTRIACCRPSVFH